MRTLCLEHDGGVHCTSIKGHSERHAAWGRDGCIRTLLKTWPNKETKMDHCRCTGCTHVKDGEHGQSGPCGGCYDWHYPTETRICYNPIQGGEKMEKWKSLKPITLKAMYEYGPCHGKFKEFVAAVMSTHPRHLFDEIPVYLARNIAEDLHEPTWFQDHGFIEQVKEEKVWEFGDNIHQSGFEYKIVSNPDGKYFFSNIKSGNHMGNIAICCKNANKITLSEMWEMGYRGE